MSSQECFNKAVAALLNAEENSHDELFVANWLKIAALWLELAHPHA